MLINHKRCMKILWHLQALTTRLTFCWHSLSHIRAWQDLIFIFFKWGHSQIKGLFILAFIFLGFDTFRSSYLQICSIQDYIHSWMSYLWISDICEYECICESVACPQNQGDSAQLSTTWHNSIRHSDTQRFYYYIFVVERTQNSMWSGHTDGPRREWDLNSMGNIALGLVSTCTRAMSPRKNKLERSAKALAIKTEVSVSNRASTRYAQANEC